MRDKFSVNYSKMNELIGCTEQTARNWRNEKNHPKSFVRDICKKLPEALDESQKIEYLNILKEQFSDECDNVQQALADMNTVEKLFEYLYGKYEQDLTQDIHFDLINNIDSNPQLRDNILKKLIINEKRTLIYHVEEIGDQEKEIIDKNNPKWKLNLDHCLFLKFREGERAYNYKILVNYNFNSEEYKQVGEIIEARYALQEYGVKMILLFANTQIPKEHVAFCMDYNMYIEEINYLEIQDKKTSKDYIYGVSDIEKDTLINKYTDIVLGRLSKYYSVIFKNILFDPSKVITHKQSENYVLWEAKFATRHHINFQTERIDELLTNAGNEQKRFHQSGEFVQGKKALAIGFLSFPSILRLAMYFEHIYLLDNSQQSISCYQKIIRSKYSDLAGKIHCITFTSVLYEYTTNLYNLYNAIDFILIGTGEGSFLKKLPIYYRMCNSWLKTNGYIYVSFLNSEFLYEYVDRITLEENFDFIPIANEHRAEAHISNFQNTYDLYCEMNDFNELKDVGEQFFKFIKAFSYPLASVLQGTHKVRLQNILKEIEKEYSKSGFNIRTFSNCKGFYIDGLFQKHVGGEVKSCILNNEGIEVENLNLVDRDEYRYFYLKTLLLAEKGTMTKNLECPCGKKVIYCILLPNYKKLPETENNEIFLGPKRFRLLSLTEINMLGIEYKNMSPFLVEQTSNLRIMKYYDKDIIESKKYCYVGDGTSRGLYKLKKNVLIEKLNEFGYEGVDIM